MVFFRFGSTEFGSSSRKGKSDIAIEIVSETVEISPKSSNSNSSNHSLLSERMPTKASAGDAKATAPTTKSEQQQPPKEPKVNIIPVKKAPGPAAAVPVAKQPSPPKKAAAAPPVAASPPKAANKDKDDDEVKTGRKKIVGLIFKHLWLKVLGRHRHFKPRKSCPKSFIYFVFMVIITLIIILRIFINSYFHSYSVDLN